MRGFGGYSAKVNALLPQQEQLLNGLAKNSLFHGKVSNDASELVLDAKTYLFRPKSSKLYMFGVGDKEKDETTVVIWGGDESETINALMAINTFDFYPYTVEYSTIYYAEDGEIFEGYRVKDRVTTPKGAGTIYSIDEINDICVELDDDKEVFYEFGANEIKRLKD